MYRHSRIGAVATALSFALAFAAGAAQSQEVVKIVASPLTGPQANYGKDNQNGAQMAIDELNAQGLTIGGNYDGVMVIAAAMKAANSTDPAKYLPALTKINYPGVTADIQFDKNGDLTKGLLTIFQVKNGKWEVVSK